MTFKISLPRTNFFAVLTHASHPGIKNSPKIWPLSVGLLQLLLHFVENQKLYTQAAFSILYRVSLGYTNFVFRQNEGGVVKELIYVENVLEPTIISFEKFENIQKRMYVVRANVTNPLNLTRLGLEPVQGQFPRLKDNLQYEEFRERKVVLHLMVLLYNFQAAKVGINQIMNTFMSKTEGFYSYSITPDANNEFETA